MIESALEAIVAADHAGRIMDFNPAAERTFGVRRQEVIGRDLLATILPPGPAAALREDIGRLLSSDPAVLVGRRVEMSGIRADGTLIPIEMAIGVYEQDGKPALVASIRDLTERLEAEVARRESESKSRFLAIMSHELRTPLNSILGFSQLLRREGFDALSTKQKRYLNHIETSGRHLLSLINDVLDLSRIAAGHLDVIREEVEVLPLFKEALAKVRVEIDTKRLELMIEPEPRLWVMADSRRLQQVLLNLLSNAIKFTPEGGRITLRSELDAGVAQIEVADTGIGIDAAHHQRVFEEFHQVDSGRTRTHPGAGLGLTLTKRLVEAMGGRIRLDSEPGRGSCFIVRLDLASPPQDKP